MSFVFSAEKAAQVASFFLRKTPRKTLTRLQLLKLMYLADRESLRVRGFPITGDKAVAMDNGPVLSEVYDLIKGSGASEPQAVWSAFLKSQRTDVILAVDPGHGKLSENDLTLLDNVFETFGHMTASQLTRYTHKLEEWQKSHAPRTSKKIAFSAIMAAVGKSDDTEEVNRRKDFDQHLAGIFGC